MYSSTASSSYCTPHYLYAPTPQKYAHAPWQQPAGSHDPRSVPTPPISSQPRKKTRVSNTPESRYRRNLGGEMGSQSVPILTPKEQPRGLLYDNYSLDDTYAEGYQLSAGTPNEDHWYHERSARDSQGRRTPVGNYSTYVKPGKPYGRQSTPPLEFETLSYGDSTPFSDSGDSRATQTEPGTQYITRRSHSAYPEATDGVRNIGGRWSPHSSPLELAQGSEASVVAARQAVTELFPELTESYNTLAEHDNRRGSRTSYYQLPPYVLPPHRFSPTAGDINLSGATSPYRSPGSCSPACSLQNDRPRCEYPVVSLESLYPLPKSPTQHGASAYTYSNHDTLLDDNYEEFGDSDAYDETDEEDSLSAILIRNSAASPYYDGSSASPEDDETPEPVTPSGSKYSSPEVRTSSSSSAHPRSQTARSAAKKSTTSTSPRRPRKPIPNNAVATEAANPAAASEKYDENDALLVHYRRQGVSYKTIKTKLNLDEAESTLRGRYRTLTKPKNERLRKPVWSEDDIGHLLDIVDPELSHIKWKQVSDNIVDRGGTYRFGSSTCKKQYLALVAEGRALPLNEGSATTKRRKHRTGPARKKD